MKIVTMAEGIYAASDQGELYAALSNWYGDIGVTTVNNLVISKGIATPIAAKSFEDYKNKDILYHQTVSGRTFYYVLNEEELILGEKVGETYNEYITCYFNKGYNDFKLAA